MSFADFFAMGGHALYVWSAYGITAVLIAGEVAAVRARLRTARQQLRATDEAA
jgi:heme exporter protein D